MKKAFTITELLVAVGLLAAVLAASTMIFHYAIGAQRTAMATAEIMRTLRAITDQLNADFAGLRTSDAPMIMEFQGDPVNVSDVNADSIVFFAAGDFQDSNGTVRGNIARIYYGQAGMSPSNVIDPNKILLRKQVILAPDEPNSNQYEPYSLSQLVNRYLATDPNTTPSNIAVAKWIVRPVDVNSTNAGSISMYLAKDVNNFSIEYCNKSDITLPNGVINWQIPSNGEKRFFGFKDPAYPSFKDYPDMIKFTFTLYDSKKILKTGRTFEHIVYVGR